MADDLLHVIEGLYSLAHAQAEVTEPLMVEGDGPVLAEELDRIRDNVIIVARSQLIKIVLVEADEAPQTLQHDLLVAHVGD